MEVIKERFEDASEPDENGLYEYYYAGYIYRFVFGKEVLIARRYDDTPHRASFMGRARKRRAGWSKRRLDGIPYGDPAFREAVQYLLRHEGVLQIQAFVDGYVTVDLDRL